MLNELQRTPLARQLYHIVTLLVWTTLWIAPTPAFTFEGKDTLKTSENKGYMKVSWRCCRTFGSFGMFRCVDC